MKSKNKKAEITYDQIFGIILAGVGVILMFWFLGYLLFSVFNSHDQVRESYFKLLNEQLERADDDLIGEFEILQNKKVEGDPSPVLVYFYNQRRVSTYSVDKEYENYICICDASIETVDEICTKEYCKSLKYPAELTGLEGCLNSGDKCNNIFNNNRNWAIPSGIKLEITKQNEEYYFNLVG